MSELVRASIDLVSDWVGMRGRAAVKPSRSRLWSPMRLCRASLVAPRAGSGVSRSGGKIFEKTPRETMISMSMYSAARRWHRRQHRRWYRRQLRPRRNRRRRGSRFGSLKTRTSNGRWPRSKQPSGPPTDRIASARTAVRRRLPALRSAGTARRASDPLRRRLLARQFSHAVGNALRPRRVEPPCITPDGALQTEFVVGLAKPVPVD